MSPLLPIHHVDSCILLEDPTTIVGKLCQRYLTRLGKIYHGKLSLTVLGEVMNEISKISNFQQKLDLLDTMNQTMEVRKLEPYSMAFEFNTDESKLKGLGGADAWILAAAIQDSANTFVTIDPRILRLRIHGIKIMHPKDVLEGK